MRAGVVENRSDAAKEESKRKHPSQHERDSDPLLAHVDWIHIAVPGGRRGGCDPIRSGNVAEGSMVACVCVRVCVCVCVSVCLPVCG